MVILGPAKEPAPKFIFFSVNESLRDASAYSSNDIRGPRCANTAKETSSSKYVQERDEQAHKQPSDMAEK